MKKFFVALLVLAIAAGNLFAEVTIGGSFVGLWKTSGSNEDDAPLKFSFKPNNGGLTDVIRPRVSVTAINDDGTFGGWAQFRPGASIVFLANGWWKPIEQVKFTYGYLWAGANPIGVALASDDMFAIPFSGRSANYLGHAYEVLNGVHIELTPIEGLYVLATLPLDNTGNIGYNGWGADDSPYKASKATAGAIFAHTMGRIAYTINGIGTARVTIAGGTGNMLAGFDPSKYPPVLTTSTDTTTIDVGFTLTAVENLAVDLGFEYKLAVDKIDGVTGNGYGADAGFTYQAPLAANVRVNFNSGAFSVAGGVAVGFGGKVTPDSDGDAYDMPLTFGVTINPAFDAGFATIGIVGDVSYTAEAKYSDQTLAKSLLSWKAIPYLTKNAGGASLSIGFEVGATPTAIQETDTSKRVIPLELDQIISWAVPIGFEYYF